VKIFVTGTESFIGKELIRQCDEKGIAISGCDAVEPTDSRFRKVDIRSQDILDAIPEGVDALVHLASLSTDDQCRDNAHDCFDVNVLGTIRLMNAAREKSAKQFIFASTEWVYDNFIDDEIKDEESLIDIRNHTSEYALSKLVSEANLRQKYHHGFCPVTILRFGIVYGPRERGGSAVESLLKNVQTKDEITVGSLKTGRCFIHVSDIVGGIISSIGLDGFNILNLQGDRLITLKDIIETSMKVTGRKPNLIEKAPDNVSLRNVSNKKATGLLDWKPEIDLETGIRGLLESSE
jgi:UDP-glucose 4-epimerase